LIGAGALSKTVDMNLSARARALLGLGLALSAVATLGCEKTAPELTSEPRPPVSAEPEVPEPGDLISEDLVVGTGVEAKTGDKVKVNYTGRLRKTNFMFDTSIGKGKKPFEFTIGKGGVIKGWDQGTVGMKVGGKRKLTIPSRLAYGDKGQPPKIPGKSTLVFEIELLTVNEVLDGGAGDGGTAGAADGGKKK
jgi:FKBP-type peptidyl-prolyl cis-trans isomerase FkpA